MEGYGELIAPLVEDKPFFESLTLEAGARYSDYKIDGAGRLRHLDLQGRRQLGAGLPASSSAATTAARSVPRTSANCSRRSRSA